MSDIKKIKEEFFLKLKENLNLNQINEIKANLFGKNGLVSSQFKKLGSVAESERKIFASELNTAKDDLQNLIVKKIQNIENKDINKKLEEEKIDVTLPSRLFVKGKIHPVSQVIDEISSIFSEIGFSVEEGPDVENEYNNFTALNTPDNHPARDMQDTFYIGENVLRTHTSPVQIHAMEKQEPPIRIIAPGRVFRCDSDVSHTPMFHQIEGLMVDKNLSFGDLQGTMDIFLQEFFGQHTKIRFRPSFFPFTCPSAEVDIECVICSGQGCRVCSKTGWLEILGCGMVDPNVFKSVNIDSNIWHGFAFGMGVERICMLKYDIDDIRLFYQGDMRFLGQF